MANVPTDGGGILIPTTTQHYSEISVVTPTLCHGFQDAGPNIQPTIGADALIPGGTGHLYQQTVPGWDRYFAELPNPSAYNFHTTSSALTMPEGGKYIMLVYLSWEAQESFWSFLFGSMGPTEDELGHYSRAMVIGHEDWEVYEDSGALDELGDGYPGALRFGGEGTYGKSMFRHNGIDSVKPYLITIDSATQEIYVTTTLATWRAWFWNDPLILDQWHGIGSPTQEDAVDDSWGTRIKVGYAAWWCGQQAEDLVASGLAGPELLVRLNWLQRPGNSTAQTIGDLTGVNRGWNGIAKSTVDGKLYSPPGNSNDGVINIDPGTNQIEIKDYGLSFPGSLQYQGIVQSSINGKLYSPPGRSDEFLVIDPDTDSATKTTFGLDLTIQNTSSFVTKFADIVEGNDGKLYCIPSASEYFVVIDPNTEDAVKTDFGLGLDDSSSKWNNAINTGDGRIVLCPYNAGEFVVLDTTTDPVSAHTTTFGLDFEGITSNAWWGMVMHSSGKLWVLPHWHRNFAIVDLDTETAEVNDFGFNWTEWNGPGIRAGIEGSDGKIYCFPYANHVNNCILVDVEENTAKFENYGFEFSAFQDVTEGSDIYAQSSTQFGPYLQVTVTEPVEMNIESSLNTVVQARNALTNKLDVAIMAGPPQPFKPHEAQAANCDFDFFQERRKAESAVMDLLIVDRTGVESSLELFIYDNTEYILFAGGLLDDNAEKSTTQTTETYEIETDTIGSGVNLSAPKYGLVGTGNTEVGILVGGELSGGTGITKTIDKYFYATKGLAPFMAALGQERSGAAAIGNNEVGLIVQGEGIDNTWDSAEIYDFATDTLTPTGPFLSSLRHRIGVNNATIGYIVGGDDAEGNRTDLIESYNFSDGSISVEDITLPASTTRMAAIVSIDHGYLLGGDTGAETDVGYKLELATGVLANLGSVLETTRANAAGGGGLYHGILNGGGEVESSFTRNSSEKLDFATDSFSPGAGLQTARKVHGALSSSPAPLLGLGDTLRRVLLDLVILGFDGPVADFTYTSDGLILQFTNESTVDPELDMVSTEWDFGDGITSTEENPSHTYSEGGTYTVSLTITDSNGESNTHTEEVEVVAVAPTAMFSYATSATFNADFVDESEAGPGSVIVAWEWDFGDSTTSTEENPSHTYDDGGSKTVTLTVTDGDGLTDTYTENICVFTDPDADMFVPTGDSISGDAKWRGFAEHEGKLYTAPWNAGDVLVYDIASDDATRTDFGLDLAGFGMWGGIAKGADGKLYCSPRGADQVLIIDPDAGSAELNDFGLDLSGSAKWSAIVNGTDNKLYCIPENADQVLIIDPDAGSAELNDFGLDLSGGTKWLGATQSSFDGKLYCAPRSADTVLIIDTSGSSPTAELNDFGLSLTGISNAWNDIAEGSDGLLYCSPATATQVLIIDPENQQAERDAFGLSLSSFVNKWSGITSAPDGKLYCAPRDDLDGLLVIEPESNTAEIQDFGIDFSSNITGTPSDQTNKWHAFVVGSDCNLYTCPNSANFMLKILMF